MTIHGSKCPCCNYLGSQSSSDRNGQDEDFFLCEQDGSDPLLVVIGEVEEVYSLFYLRTTLKAIAIKSNIDQAQKGWALEALRVHCKSGLINKNLMRAVEYANKKTMIRDDLIFNKNWRLSDKSGGCVNTILISRFKLGLGAR